MSLGLGLMISGSGTGSAAPATVKVLAHRLSGPGYNSGAAPPTGDGTQKTFTGTFQNDSGAAIATTSVVLQGWTLRTTGTTDASASFTVSGTIEFPVGTTVGTIPATVVTPGANVESADITLSSSISAGGSFKVNLSATPANGATYIANLGFAGMRNHALKSAVKKAAVAGFGDSIMTNNGGSLYNAALGRCGAYLNSISSTTAQTYAADFSKQADLAAKLGCTHVVTNFGTNDMVNGATLSQLQGYLGAMRDAVRAKNVKFAQITIIPRMVSAGPISTTLTSSGNTITATVPDASIFVVTRPYNISGATQSEYNFTFFCTGKDTNANTVTFFFPGSATSPATGSPVITPWQIPATPATQVPLSAAFAAGGSSLRGQLNAWTRSGVFDSVLDWGDACEPTRDAGRFVVPGESALLPGTQTITISSVINTSRFNSNYSAGSSTIVNGFVTCVTGNNIGQLRLGNGNTNGDITVTQAFTNAQQVGDTLYANPGVSYMSDDGTHPRVSTGGKGGQQHLDNATAAWLDALLA